MLLLCMQSTKFNMYYCTYSDEYDHCMCVYVVYTVLAPVAAVAVASAPVLVTLLMNHRGCRDLGDPNTHYKINTHT